MSNSFYDDVVLSYPLLRETINIIIAVLLCCLLPSKLAVIYTAILVVSLTYFAMPILNRLLRRWLYPGSV
jgi:antibiotic biosynthesis monooxygenase (ABM) superfamily enzyme